MGAERNPANGGAGGISHLVEAVGLLGALAPEHHLPQLLRRLQGERARNKVRAKGSGVAARQEERGRHLVRAARWQRTGAIGVRPREQAGRGGVGAPHRGRLLHLPHSLSRDEGKGREGNGDEGGGVVLGGSSTREWGPRYNQAGNANISSRVAGV